MKHTHEKKNEMTRSFWMLPVILVAVIILILGAAAPELRAWGNKEKIELDEAEIFFEENATDKDLGIQFFLDGEAWKWIKIFGPHWNKLLDVKVRGSARVIGLTELFSESAEPSYVGEDRDMTRAELLALFPAGTSRFFGRTVEGNWLSGETELTQDIPCAPKIKVFAQAGTITVRWRKVVDVVDPEWDPEDEDEDADQECTDAPEDFEIAGYEAVFEMEVEDDSGEERVFVNTGTLSADKTSFTASPEFVEMAAEFRAAGKLLELKVEVLAIEASGNKAITEETLWPVDD